MDPHPNRSSPKSDLSDFGFFNLPNSGKPEFGRKAGTQEPRHGRPGFPLAREWAENAV